MHIPLCVVQRLVYLKIVPSVYLPYGTCEICTGVNVNEIYIFKTFNDLICFFFLFTVGMAYCAFSEQ